MAIKSFKRYEKIKILLIYFDLSKKANSYFYETKLKYKSKGTLILFL
jgi:hypothetical protein